MSLHDSSAYNKRKAVPMYLQHWFQRNVSGVVAVQVFERIRHNLGRATTVRYETLQLAQTNATYPIAFHFPPFAQITCCYHAIQPAPLLGLDVSLFCHMTSKVSEQYRRRRTDGSCCNGQRDISFASDAKLASWQSFRSKHLGNSRLTRIASMRRDYTNFFLDGKSYHQAYGRAEVAATTAFIQLITGSPFS